MDPQQAEQAVALIHQIASSRTWLAMKDESRLDLVQGGQATGWAIRTLLDSLRRNGSRKGPD